MTGAGSKKTEILMLKNMLLAGTALLVGAASASAADLPVRGAAPAPVMASGSWAGFYAGVVGTGAFGTVVTDDQWCWVACTSNTTSGFGTGVGVTLGFNFQRGNLVYGLEGDFSGLLLKPERGWWDPDRDYGVKQEHKINWYSTVRGRIGVALGSSLIYTTAGLALVNSDNKSVYYYDDGSAEEGFFKKQTTLGFAAGMGLEHSFGNNWSLKAEYMYIATRSTKPVIYVGCCSPTMEDNATFTPSMHALRVGLNYRFGTR